MELIKTKEAVNKLRKDLSDTQFMKKCKEQLNYLQSHHGVKKAELFVYKNLKATDFKREWIEVLSKIAAGTIKLGTQQLSPFDRCLARIQLLFRNSALTAKAEAAIAAKKAEFVKEEIDIKAEIASGDLTVYGKKKDAKRTRKKTKRKCCTQKKKLHKPRVPAMINRRVKLPGKHFNSPAFAWFVGIIRKGTKANSVRKKRFWDVAFSDGIWSLTTEELVPALLPVGDASSIADIASSADELAEELITDLADDTDDESDGDSKEDDVVDDDHEPAELSGSASD